MTRTVMLTWVALLAAGILVSQVSCGAGDATAPAATSTGTAADTSVFKTQKEKLGYCVGVDLARNFQRQGIEIDPETLVRGLKDVFSNGKLAMTDEEMMAAMTAFQVEMKQKQAKALSAVADENTKEGAAFLAANKTKEGVVTLPSGLQYKIIKAGDGKKPVATDTVEVNYRGTLINGTEFDSSYKRGQPATFKVTDVIPGWTEALQLMPVGSKWQVFIPSNLAYAARGAGGVIGPNSTLIFDVELLSIKAPTEPANPTKD
jgi:FKBP-type peptidyl-prolyl cis-trans isomerase